MTTLHYKGSATRLLVLRLLGKKIPFNPADKTLELTEPQAGYLLAHDPENWAAYASGGTVTNPVMVGGDLAADDTESVTASTDEAPLHPAFSPVKRSKSKGL